MPLTNTAIWYECNNAKRFGTQSDKKSRDEQALCCLHSIEQQNSCERKLFDLENCAPFDRLTRCSIIIIQSNVFASCIFSHRCAAAQLKIPFSMCNAWTPNADYYLLESIILIIFIIIVLSHMTLIACDGVGVYASADAIHAHIYYLNLLTFHANQINSGEQWVICIRTVAAVAATASEVAVATTTKWKKERKKNGCQCEHSTPIGMVQFDDGKLIILLYYYYRRHLSI